MKTNLFLADKNDEQYVRPQSFEVQHRDEFIYLCVMIDWLSSWTFHFVAGVICMIEAHNNNNNNNNNKLNDYISFGTSHFSS